jgi:hypothetical protein
MAALRLLEGRQFRRCRCRRRRTQVSYVVSVDVGCCGDSDSGDNRDEQDGISVLNDGRNFNVY